MKPSKLYEALHALIGERVPLHIWGACGVGKSQIVAQVARDLRLAHAARTPDVQWHTFTDQRMKRLVKLRWFHAFEPFGYFRGDL